MEVELQTAELKESQEYITEVWAVYATVFVFIYILFIYTYI